MKLYDFFYEARRNCATDTSEEISDGNADKTKSSKVSSR